MIPFRHLLATQGGDFGIIASEQGHAETDNITVTTPTGTADGDLLLAFGASDAIGSWTASGFTIVASYLSGRLLVAHRTISGSPAANYSFSHSSGIADLSAVLVTVRSAAFGKIGTAGGAQAPSITMDTGGLLFAFFIATDAGLNIPTPTGMTLLNSYNALAPSLYLFSEEVLAGATGSRGGTSGPHSSVLVGVYED